MCAFLRSNKTFVIRGIIVSIGQAEGTNLLTLLHIAQIAHLYSRPQTQQDSRLCKTFNGYRNPITGISALSRLPVATSDTLFQSPTLSDLSPVEACAIAAGWNRVRQLAAVHQLPSLHFEIISSELPYLPPTLAGPDPNSRNEQDFHLDQRPLDRSQFKDQDEFQRRLYQAVSALWLVLSLQVLSVKNRGYVSLIVYLRSDGTTQLYSCALRLRKRSPLIDTPTRAFNSRMCDGLAPDEASGKA